MIHLKLKTYNKVFAIIIGIGFMGMIFNSADIKRRIRDLPYIKAYYEDYFTAHIQFQRRLATKLLKAEEDLVWGKKSDALFKIRAVVALLDSRYHYSSLPDIKRLRSLNLSFEEKWSVGLRPLSDASEDASLSQIRVEPKINLGSIPIPFSDTDLGHLVTILIDDCDQMASGRRREKNSRIFSQIRNQWKSVKIVLATHETDVKSLHSLHSFDGVEVIGVLCDSWNRAPLKPFLSYVQSPYVLLLSSTAAVTSDLNITRLLRVSAEMKGVGVVGISERGKDGGWDYTCLQLHFRNSHLSISDGYEYSQEACLFCDITSASFLAATSVLHEIQPDTSLPLHPRQVDWAMKLHKYDVLTVTCPDVMIHTTNNVVTVPSQPQDDKPCKTLEEKVSARDEHLQLKRLYRKLAQRYELNSISFHNRTLLEYNCLEIHYRCKAMSKVKEYLLPPCCIKMKNTIIKRYNSFTKTFLIPYTLNVGTLLGAVKFKNHLPWDPDDDVQYQNSDMGIFKRFREMLKQIGIPSSFKSINKSSEIHNYITISGKDGFTLDSWGIGHINEYIQPTDTTKLPDNIPCLQFGHYAVPIRSFLADFKNISNKIIEGQRKEAKRYKELKNKHRKTTEELLVPDKFPHLPEPKCYLFSFVKLGELWAPAPLNPALQAMRLYGNNLFKHEPHWRFKNGLTNSWPNCSKPRHPMCLNIHPLDGNLEFL